MSSKGGRVTVYQKPDGTVDRVVTQIQDEIMVQVNEPVTDQVIARIQKTMTAPKKRLRKDCPCPRCCDWRFRRKLRANRKPKGTIQLVGSVDPDQVNKMKKAFYANLQSLPREGVSLNISVKKTHPPTPAPKEEFQEVHFMGFGLAACQSAQVGNKQITNESDAPIFIGRKKP